jgi:hypothetical protein
MNLSKLILFLATELVIFGATGFSLRAASSKWDDLAILKPGQQIRVVLNGAKSYEGPFQALDHDGIILGRAAGGQTFARRDVLRIYSKSKNHRVRNLVIGAAIGATLAAIAVKVNSSSIFENTGTRDIGWICPVGVVAFTIIGAAIPTGGWHEVYRAPQH